jgi:hypothetical protein
MCFTYGLLDTAAGLKCPVDWMELALALVWFNSSGQSGMLSITEEKRTTHVSSAISFACLKIVFSTLPPAIVPLPETIWNGNAAAPFASRRGGWAQVQGNFNPAAFAVIEVPVTLNEVH